LKLKDFIEKYTGKPVDFDGMYGCQCVDLVRQYFQDVWGCPRNRQPEGVDGAIEFFSKADRRPLQSALCGTVGYNGSYKPEPGDVLVFKPSEKNKYGHIGVCIAAEGEYMAVFEQHGLENEQNLKDGKPQRGAYIGLWDYTRLAGWLTPKKQG
jgi:hypothetical protein